VAESSLYEILEVSPAATLAEIKSAYRRLAPQVHPDQGGSRALFRLVQEAYETLSDTLARSEYDGGVATDAPLGHVVPALAGRSPEVRGERSKWVRALLAQERAARPGLCLTV
jgi:curved DNA-binding protein CbpA